MKIRTTDDQRDKIRDALLQPNAAWNEVIWTYLAAELLAEDFDGTRAQQLFGATATPSEPWFEAKPMPPREREGNTRVDLAAGAIRQRGDTASGIEFDVDAASPWVGFVEAKVLSDCSLDVANDHARNQITRVIENLLCFQTAGRYPERTHFTLLTPNYFKEARHRRTRLYGYKFSEYEQNRQALLGDIDLCTLARRTHTTWTYPKLDDRLERLQLHWASYEDVFAGTADLAGVDVAKSAREGVLPPAVRERIEASLGEVS